MNRILQPEPWPWWAIILLIVGGVIAISGLAILMVPPKNWRKIWRGLRGIPRWIRETPMWMLFGPKVCIGNPEIKSEVSANGLEIHYTAMVKVSICNKSKSIRVNISSLRVSIEQQTEWGEDLIVVLRGKWVPAIEVDPKGIYIDEFVVQAVCSGNPEHFPNLQIKYVWGLTGINITLPKVGTRVFHKGLYRERTQHTIGII